MNRIVPLDIHFTFEGHPNAIHPVLLKDEQNLVLVDCGYPGFLPLLEHAAKAQGLDFRDLTQVLVTHHDFDHLGALGDLKRAYPQVSVLSSRLEAPFIEGKAKSLRLAQAEALFDSLPEAMKEKAEQFHHLLRSVVPVPVDQTLEDRQLLPWCGGTKVVLTPGHMPGHLSLYVREAKTLIAGDALVIEEGALRIANPQYTLDKQEAERSIRKLLGYEIETIVCYHGGLFRGEVKPALEKLLKDRD